MTSDGQNPKKGFFVQRLDALVKGEKTRKGLVSALDGLGSPLTALRDPELERHVVFPLMRVEEKDTHLRQTDAYLYVQGGRAQPIEFPVLAGEVGLCALARGMTLTTTVPRVDALPADHQRVVVLRDPRPTEGELLRKDPARGECYIRRRDAIVALLLGGGFHGLPHDRPQIRFRLNSSDQSSRLLVRAGREAFDLLIEQWTITTIGTWRLFRTDEFAAALVSAPVVWPDLIDERVEIMRWFGLPVPPAWSTSDVPRIPIVSKPNQSFLRKWDTDLLRERLAFMPSSLTPGALVCFWTMPWSTEPEPGVFFELSPCDLLVAYDPHTFARLCWIRLLPEFDRGDALRFEMLPDGWCVTPWALAPEQIDLLAALTTFVPADRAEMSCRLIGAKYGPSQEIHLYSSSASPASPSKWGVVSRDSGVSAPHPSSTTPRT